MKWLFTSDFCPNDCDRPVSTFLIKNTSVVGANLNTGDPWLAPPPLPPAPPTPHAIGVLRQSMQWLHGRYSMDGAKLWLAHVDECVLNQVPAVINGFRDYPMAEGWWRSVTTNPNHTPNHTPSFPFVKGVSGYGPPSRAVCIRFAPTFLWCLYEEP